jgi:hypothetical protein
MKYTTYDVATGAVGLVYDVPDAEHFAANLTDKSWIEGDYSAGYYIESGVPVAMPADPSTALAPYKFDHVSKFWQLDQSAAEFLNRVERNRLLADIDRVNPVWYDSLAADQQQQLITYRQALLDVPQQSEFPATVNWPAKPTWL